MKKSQILKSALFLLVCISAGLTAPAQKKSRSKTPQAPVYRLPDDRFGYGMPDALGEAVGKTELHNRHGK